jgi:polyhydroxybutyrate depolymerase
MTRRVVFAGLSALLLLLLLVVVGCSRGGDGATGPAPGDTAVLTPEAAGAGVKPGVDPVGTKVDATISLGGLDRTYHVYLPSALPRDQSVPLLVALHGGTGWGTQFEANSGFDRLAEANGFIVVYPDGVGLGRNADRMRTWNAGLCCGPAQKNQIDDVGFVSAVIDQVGADRHIDLNRVFVTGHSNGAMLSYRVACELSDKVAAIGVVAGSLAVDPCPTRQPVSVMEVHGTGDTHVPIEGGHGANGVAGVDFPSPREGVATMARLAGCVGDPNVTADGDLTTTEWRACDGATTVKLVAITGAEHAWPGSAPTRVNAAGPPYPGYDASREIWAFLSTHPRSGGGGR